MNASLFGFSGIKILLLLVAASLVFPAPAMARSYRVELVIFENRSEPQQEFPSASSSSYQTSQRQNAASLSNSNYVSSPLGLRWLGGAVAKLNSSGHYRVLKTLAWSQRGGAAYAYSPLINVSAPDKQLQGTVRVYAPNLLYAELDLKFAPYTAQATSPPISSSMQAAADTENQNLANPVASEAMAMQYFLQEKRRLKLKEIHYFDNPRFGAVLIVIPQG